MKQHRFLLRVFAVLLAFCFTVSCAGSTVLAQEDEFEGMSPQEKQAAIEQRLKEVNEKLTQLGEESDETQDYINALDEKIKYLGNQLDLSEQNIESSKDKIKSLEQQYSDNEAEIAQIQLDIEALGVRSSELELSFNDSYSRYCRRLRAMYISGNTSTLSMLLTSSDISTLFTRLEMVKRVSISDKLLLQELRDEATELETTKSSMQEKSAQLATDQKALVTTKENLESSITTLESQQVDYASKQEAYESQKAESDEKLKKLHEQENTYSEYRNRDQAELDAINAEINAAAEAYRKKIEAQRTTTAPETTATTTTEPATTTTTTEPTQTQEGEDGGADVSEGVGEAETTEPVSETTTEATTQATTTTQPSDKLSFTYPVPSQTSITCGYGSAGYAGHTGVDFSCPEGVPIVAVESGYVIISRDLTDSNGNYRSYGRYIVIMHDKTDSAGNFVYTLYAHNSSRVVSEGAYVTKGQLIAYSGSTGNSTGPHCHFEVRTPTADYSNCVNPTPFLP